MSRNAQIVIVVAAVVLAAAFVAGATQAPGTAMQPGSESLAPCAQTNGGPVGCQVDAEASCHGSEGCPGPDSEDCEGHDDDCDENCHADDGEPPSGCQRGGRGGCHG